MTEIEEALECIEEGGCSSEYHAQDVAKAYRAELKLRQDLEARLAETSESPNEWYMREDIADAAKADHSKAVAFVNELTRQLTEAEASLAAVTAERDAFKRQSACLECGDRHFNVALCSKCAFKHTLSHACAAVKQERDHLRQDLAAAVAVLKKIGARQWEPYTKDGGPEDMNAQENGMLMYIGATVTDAKDALTRLASPAAALNTTEGE